MRAKRKIGADLDAGDSVDPSETPYRVEEFAEKYGLSLKDAEIVLGANGPSRHKCDAGAKAFLEALAAYRRRKF